MVAREGAAPPISGCRPDVILFHHRAEKIGCRGWNCTRIHAFKERCPTIGRLGNWWPARVTRPVLRIKSPLHHFNACKPAKWEMVLGAGFAPALSTLSTSCLFWLGYASERDGASCRCCPGANSLQKKSAGCCREASDRSPALARLQKYGAPPGVAPSSFPYQRNASLKMLWGQKSGGSGECCPLCLSHVKRALCW